MKFPDLLPGIFLKRINRFTALIEVMSGEKVQAYVPTTGRLTGVLRRGGRVWLASATTQNRKLHYDLVLAELEEDGLCSVNAALANQLFEEALLNEALGAFPYKVIQREVSFGASRLDFRLTDHDHVCWVEVKSVTYGQDGVGMFPDAPTERGQKHLQELASLTAKGDRASVVFIAQRGDAVRFAPYKAIDPEFTAILKQVHAQGVDARAYRCDVSLERVEIAEEIPVEL